MDISRYDHYRLKFDTDMELKAKDLAIAKYEEITKGVGV